MQLSTPPRSADVLSREYSSNATNTRPLDGAPDQPAQEYGWRGYEMGQLRQAFLQTPQSLICRLASMSWYEPIRMTE